MKLIEISKTQLLLNEKHIKKFENLCRNITKGRVTGFGNSSVNGSNTIYIMPQASGYTNTYKIVNVQFTEKMEIEHISFDENNNFLDDIKPCYFYKDNYKTEATYRICFKISNLNIKLTIIFNKDCKIINKQAIDIENNKIIEVITQN